jgi:hypothetical protein
MSSIEKLDFVLKSMQDYDGQYLNLTEITKQSEILDKININELPSIVIKLLKDGYIDFETKLPKDTIFESDKRYMITFEGKLLNETGGYGDKAKRETISTNLKLVQTWAIAVGTALAGLYAFYQLLTTMTTSCR